MMFSKDDFVIDDPIEFAQFLPIMIFVGFVFPFVFVAYQIGFIMDLLGWLKSE